MKPFAIFSVLVAFALEGMARNMAPDAPQKVAVEIPGTWYAYEWQGKIHAFDHHGFRRLDGPWPEKGDRLRIAAIGDSFTMGMGVGADEAWPAQLERLTGAEVLNLGVSGDQSTHALDHARFATKRLHADVLVYAACLNDVVPDDDVAWDTQALNRLTTSPSVFLREVAMRVPQMRLMIHRHGDLARFERDVETMRYLGVPVVASVFDTFGMDSERDAEEQAIRSAGVPLAPFRIERGDWRVGRWEAHPNAEAHRRFAETVAREIP